MPHPSFNAFHGYNWTLNRTLTEHDHIAHHTSLKMLALWQEAERRQTLSRHHREKGLLAFEKLEELYRRQEPIRHPHSKILGKTSHHRYSQMKRQREMDLLLKQVKELVAKERDPEFQAKQRQIRRLEEANQFIVDHDLRHFMDDKMKAEVSRQRAHIQAMEEQKAQWKADMECEIALADAREKKNIEITMSELVLGVLLVVIIVFAIFH